MGDRKPDINVEYLDGTIEDFKSVKSASMDDAILVVFKQNYKKVVILENTRNVTIFNKEVMEL